MAINDVTITLLDGNLGILPQETDNIVVVLGASTRGLWNTMYSFGSASISAVKTAIGTGKGTQLVAHIMSTPNHGPVYYFPLASTAGVNNAVTAPSSSAPALTLTGNPMDDLEGIVKIVTGGAVGTATFQYSLDNGKTFSGVITTAATYAMDVGLSYTAVTSAGTTPPVITLTGTALVEHNLRVEATVVGILGTSKVRISIDGGKTWNADVLTAATLPVLNPVDGTATGLTLNIAAGTAALDNVWTATTQGMLLNFAAGTYVANDQYVWTSNAPTISNTQVTDALTALINIGVDVGWVYVANQVGGASDTARGTALASLFSAVDTKIVALQASPSYKFVGCYIEAPDAFSHAAASNLTTWRNAMIVAAAGLSSKLTGIAAGMVRITSDLDSRQYRRCAGWPAVARLSSVTISTHLGRVLDGSLRALVSNSLEHDEAVTPGLDGARFVTLRTVAGRQGYFVTNGQQMAPNGSDYAATERLRVINRVSKVGRNALLNYLNSDVLVNKATGFIREDEAQSIDADLLSQCSAAVVQNQQASAVGARVSRTDDILSTSTLSGEFAVQPKGYAKTITFNLGFAKTIA